MSITDSVPQVAVSHNLAVLFPFWTFETARNGMPVIRENGLLLHSAYDPMRDSQRAARQADGSRTAVFFGFGAGYFPVAYVIEHPETPIVLVEPDISHFLAALALLDWSPVFCHRECIFAIGCQPETVLPLLTRAGSGLNHCTFFSQQAQTQHAASYFDHLVALVDRNRQKDDINTNTLERFAGLWLRNSCRNIRKFAQLDGVNIYRKAAGKIPAVVLAAGPSLEGILPLLTEIKKRSLVICVDTALRACLATGTEPDFIILVDPQYWAARHIAGLAAPSSVLITESAVCPSVYRFPCRKIVLCSSLFPLGTYFERHLGVKGKLDAGGSVSTTAWDFARFIGAQEIYVAGLDLGYPGGKTHIRGSTFEENAHTKSCREGPAETSAVRTIFGAGPEYGTDFAGNKLLTDKRMQLFAWWFESKIAAETSSVTYTFSRQGLFIPGIRPCQVTGFLEKQIVEKQKAVFFRQAEQSVPVQDETAFNNVYKSLLEALDELYHTAQKGERLCSKALADSGYGYTRTVAGLSDIDHIIMENSIKDAASLVFPTEKQLETILSREPLPQDPRKATLVRSRVIYRELCKAVQKYKSELLQ